MEGKAVGADFSRRKNIAFFSRLPASVSRVGRATDIEHLNPKHHHPHQRERELWPGQGGGKASTSERERESSGTESHFQNPTPPGAAHAT